MRIIIADSSPLYSQGVKLALDSEGITANTLMVDSYPALEKALERIHGKVMIVVDSRLNGLSELEDLAGLKLVREANILMMTDSTDVALMRRARMTGIDGVVAKTAPLSELGEALREVLAGGTWRFNERVSLDQWGAQKTRLGYALCRLSNQENKVLNLVKCGLRNKQIADRMSLTEHTVKTHMSSILRKLEMENRTQLVVALQQI